MQKRIPLVFCFLLLNLSHIRAKTVRQKMVIETEQNIQSVIFKHILEAGTTVKELHLIDGVQVSKDEYDCALDQAEQKERQLHRKIEEERNYAKVEFVSSSQLHIYKKLLSKIFAEIKQWLTRLDIPIVCQYYQFSVDTIPSKGAFEAFKNDLFFKAQVLLDEYNDQQDVVSLQKMLDQYEKVPYRLERFFQNSVQQAIDHCDDTKILKELLSLINPLD